MLPRRTRTSLSCIYQRRTSSCTTSPRCWATGSCTLSGRAAAVFLQRRGHRFAFFAVSNPPRHKRRLLYCSGHLHTGSGTNSRRRQVASSCTRASAMTVRLPPLALRRSRSFFASTPSGPHLRRRTHFLGNFPTHSYLCTCGRRGVGRFYNHALATDACRV